MKHSFIYFASVAMLLASCTGRTDPDMALVDAVENNLLPAVIVEGEENQGMNLLERMEHYHVPGVSIAFLDGGRIAWAKGYGFTSADSSRAVDAQTLFQAASISKPVAALAALALVEEGKIGLDEDVNMYLKGWQVEENQFTSDEKVTLRRILSHSAGLTVHGFAGYAYAEDVPELVQILNGEEPANSDRIYPDTVPGSQYSYSGGGYTIMQKMLCDVTGKTFPDLMEEAVLKKIPMNSSTYRQPLPEDRWENAACGHRADGKMIEGRWHTYPEMAAAGLWTNPSDLLEYAMEVQRSYAGTSNRILSREMTHEMLTAQMDSHGLGPGVGGAGDSIYFSHGGANEGYRCGLLAFTKLGQGFAIMTNGDQGGALISEIQRSFSSIYGWTIFNPVMKTVVYLKDEDLRRYSGQYKLSYQGQDMILEISVAGDHLKGTQLWNEFPFEMYPESATRFFNKEDGARFEFSLDENGTPAGITIYEGSAEYSFQKI
jgi:CubicO group peptidase (beta-lactamase class C family)